MAQSENQRYLSFSLGGERYAVEVQKVHEVLEYTRITPLPRMDIFMKGIIDLRGTGIPVVDLRLKFGLPEAPINKDSAIIVLEVGGQGASAVMGALVDAVEEVVELPPESIDAPPRLGSRLAVDGVIGVAKREDGFIVLIDMDELFHADEQSSMALAQEPATADAV